MDLLLGAVLGKSLRPILTQEQFAKAIKVDKSTLAKWGREEHQPLPKKLAALEAFLHWLPDSSC